MPSIGLRICGSLALASLATGGFWLSACGPSVQYSYESQIRFEHCNRLDFDPKIVPTHRRACWNDWLLRYAKDQTRDRVEYARRRIDSLAVGERSTLTLELPEPDDAGTQRTTEPAIGAPAPAPTSAHVPPPSRMPAAPSSAPSANESRQR